MGLRFERNEYGMLSVDNDTGIITKVENVKSDDGKTILRATVEFYDGNSPPITFGDIWGQTPIRIVPVKSETK